MIPEWLLSVASVGMGALAVWQPNYSAKRRIRRTLNGREASWLVARGLIELGLTEDQVADVMSRFRRNA